MFGNYKTTELGSVLWPAILFLAIALLSPSRIRAEEYVFIYAEGPQTYLTREAASDATHISFFYGTVTMAEDLQNLRFAVNLQKMRIDGPRVTPEGLAHARDLKHVKYLHVYRLVRPDECMEVLSKFPALETIIIRKSDEKITNRSSSAISKMSKLKYLDLTDADIDTDFFRSHSLPSSVTHLVLIGTNVDSRVVEFLPDGITHLVLSNTKVNSAAIPLLKKRKNLKVLFVDQISSDESDELERALPDTAVNDHAERFY